MSEFEAYFRIGFFHIIALDGIDHILFVIALAAVYRFADWRKVLFLITAFTIGHSITLLLASLEFIPIYKPLIEVLIPLTILLTTIENFLTRLPVEQNFWHLVRYFLALTFGLIHGLAFAKDLQALFALSQESILLKLLAFNIGIEAGQAVLVVAVLFFAIIFVANQTKRLKYWNYGLSGIASVVSVVMIFYKLFSF